MTRRARRRGGRVLTVALLGATAGCSVVGSAATPEADGEPVPVPVPGPVSVVEPVRRFDEIRGLWIVRSAMTREEQVRTMVQRAAEAGFNTLLVQIRGRGDAFYASDLEPRAESVPGDASFDPLAMTIDEAHRRGIAVHAWVNTHLVWGPTAPPRSRDHIVNAHPEWLAVPRSLGRELHDQDPRGDGFTGRLLAHARANAGTVEGVYTSPSDPAVKEHVKSIWMDLASRYDLDGIHFDYIRYPSGDFDYSAGALRRFRHWVTPRVGPERAGELIAASREDPYAMVDALPDLWSDFRRENITDLVRRIYHGVKEVRPQLVVSAAVFANQADAFTNRFQAWPSWLEEGILDVAVPMAYTTDQARFSGFIRAGRASAKTSHRLWAGVGAYLNSVDGTLEQIDRARTEGAGGIVVFSYDWAASAGRDADGFTLLQQIGRSKFANR